MKMKLIVLLSLFVGTIAVPMFQSVAVNDDGSYNFAYETGKEGGSHSRSEKRDPNGVVVGKFSYEDPNGALREIRYRADSLGYFANGDVSVEGAPKGQFPVMPESQDEISPKPVADEAKEESAEPQEAAESNPDVDDHKDDDFHDLPLEDSSANDPPEAFPEGYFLQKFQGLRRLPEPTKKEPSSTTSAPTEAPVSEASPESVADENRPDPPPTETKDAANEDYNKIIKEPASEKDLLMHVRPFQGFHSAWTSAMFNQPVYVFSYQQPESFGYYYYY